MPVDRALLDQVLESGARAPSGDNLQPWKVAVSGDKVVLSVDQERDRSLYNFEGRASLIALGAMIENITIAGRQLGVGVDTKLAPNGSGLVSAYLTLGQTESHPDRLFDAIALRCTNRKPYRIEPLGPAVSTSIRASVSDSGASLLLIDDREQMRLVARAASLNDRLLFEFRPLHDRFYESVRWTEADAESTRDGLYVKTLELGAMEGPFKASRSWSAVRLLSLLGASRLAPHHSFQTFMRSGAFVFLQVSGVTQDAIVQGGRVMERLWLTITSHGLSVQPMSGMLCLLPYLRPSNTGEVSPSALEVIAQADSLLRRVLPLSDAWAPVMLFRVGYGQTPTAIAKRRAVLASGTR